MSAVRCAAFCPPSLRLARAAWLLEQGDGKRPDIAAEIGLDNLSHVHRLVRERFGMTPRAGRERHRKAPF